MAVVAVVMVATFRDYGFTYDEEAHIRYGERVLAFYTEGFEARGSLRRSSYGAAFDLLAALVRRVSPWDEFVTNHWLCVFVAQLGLLGTWRLGRSVAGPLGGLSALVFLVLTPVYYGHQFNNPKDIPFAAGYVWALYCIARLLRAGSEPGPLALGWRFWVSLAVALALGMSVRVGGAVLLGYLLGFAALSVLDTWRVHGPAAARQRAPVLARASGAALGGWLLMVAFWPRALASPISGPAAALETVTRYTAYDSPTLLDGRVIPSQKLPWDYLPTYFGLQLPELVMLGAALAAVWICWTTARALSARRTLRWELWLLIAAVCAPPAYAILRRSTLYNGLRHFLFIVPPLCVLAALALTACSEWLERRARYARVAPALLLAVFGVDQAYAAVRLHPHQHVYFNRIAGGVRAANERYETEYYGSVYPELLEQVLEHVWTERRDEYYSRTFRISGCGSKLFFARNLPLNFEYQSMRRAERADYYATYVRDGCLRRFRDRKRIGSVERDGAVLAVARDMKVKARKASARREEGRP